MNTFAGDELSEAHRLMNGDASDARAAREERLFAAEEHDDFRGNRVPEAGAGLAGQPGYVGVTAAPKGRGIKLLAFGAVGVALLGGFGYYMAAPFLTHSRPQANVALMPMAAPIAGQDIGAGAGKPGSQVMIGSDQPAPGAAAATVSTAAVPTGSLPGAPGATAPAAPGTAPDNTAGAPSSPGAGLAVSAAATLPVNAAPANPVGAGMSGQLAAGAPAAVVSVAAQPASGDLAVAAELATLKARVAALEKERVTGGTTIGEEGSSTAVASAAHTSNTAPAARKSAVRKHHRSSAAAVTDDADVDASGTTATPGESAAPATDGEAVADATVDDAGNSVAPVRRHGRRLGKGHKADGHVAVDTSGYALRDINPGEHGDEATVLTPSGVALKVHAGSSIGGVKVTGVDADAGVVHTTAGDIQ